MRRLITARPRILVLFACTVSLLWSGVTRSAERPVTGADANFINDFVTIALEREYGGANAGRLIKWARPVRVGVMGDEAFYYLPAVEQLVDELREATSHPVNVVRGGGEKDALLVFVHQLVREEIDRYRSVYRPFFRNDEAYERQLAHIQNGTFNAVCLTTLRTQPRDGTISGAIIFIPVSRGLGTIWQCIVEELAQSMGLPNDSDTVFYSIFNDRSPHVSLTPKDKRMLRLLYHPKLKPNMAEPEVRRVLAEILNEQGSRGRLP
jgi:hypothetical protein